MSDPYSAQIIPSADSARPGFNHSRAILTTPTRANRRDADLSRLFASYLEDYVNERLASSSFQISVSQLFH